MVGSGVGDGQLCCLPPLVRRRAHLCQGIVCPPCRPLPVVCRQVPALGGDSLFGALTKATSENLAHFPTVSARWRLLACCFAWRSTSPAALCVCAVLASQQVGKQPERCPAAASMAASWLRLLRRLRLEGRPRTRAHAARAPGPGNLLSAGPRSDRQLLDLHDHLARGPVPVPDLG